jgi:hypothetical protein
MSKRSARKTKEKLERRRAAYDKLPSESQNGRDQREEIRPGSQNRKK